MPRTSHPVAEGIGEALKSIAGGYAQSQERSRVSDLLQKLQTATPMEAVQIYGQIDPELALKYNLEQIKNQRAQAITQKYPGLPGGQQQPQQTQPGFTPNAPSMAARNATAPMMQNFMQQPQTGTEMPQQQMAPQGMQAQQPPTADEQLAIADQFRKRAADYAAAGMKPQADVDLAEANAIENRVTADQKRQDKLRAENQKQLLDIHKLEAKKYDTLEAEGQQAKKTSRAREIMRAQLASGKLNPKNTKNLLANFFKGNPTLEGLLTTPEREVFKSAGITQFEGMKDIFGVRLSDADLAVASSKVMDPTKPVEANLAIADFWDFADKMKIEEAKIAREVKKDNGGFLPINWREQVDSKMQERFGDEAQRVVSNAANEGGTRPLKIVDGKVAIIAPDGRRKLIPQERLKEAMLAGGIPE